MSGFCAALADDLNTSEARAAIFDLVRAGNVAADSGKLLAGNVAGIDQVLQRFDEVFAVLEDRDAEIARSLLQWAQEEGRGDQAAPELVAAYSLTDEQIDALLKEARACAPDPQFRPQRQHPQRAGLQGAS